MARETHEGQRLLSFAEVAPGGELFEYVVLVTSLELEISSLGQLCRDRGDAENVFDELKNQWGWGGFTTRDIARCRLIARIQALVYDWWTLFARLIDPERHSEAITSRSPLHAVARRSRHGKQTRLKLTSSHGDNPEIRRSLARVSGFLSEISETAGRLSDLEKWCRILSRALVKYLKGCAAASIAPYPPKNSKPAWMKINPANSRFWVQVKGSGSIDPEIIRHRPC